MNTLIKDKGWSRGSKRGIEDDGSNVENVEPKAKRPKSLDVDEDGMNGVGHSDDDFVKTPKHKGGDQFTISANNKSKAAPLKASDRTSKYIFSSPSVAPEPEDEEDEAIKQRKKLLHERFVKKLGRPESIAEIKRRSSTFGEEGEEEDGGDDDEEEEAPPKPTKGRKGAAPAKKKLTPMIQQIVDIKLAHMDTLLVIEVGYKCYFYGEDARIASKELGVFCSPGKMRFDDRRSLTASLIF